MKTALILYLMVQCSMGLWAVGSSTYAEGRIFNAASFNDFERQKQKRTSPSATPAKAATLKGTQTNSPTPTVSITLTPVVKS